MTAESYLCRCERRVDVDELAGLRCIHCDREICGDAEHQATYDDLGETIDVLFCDDRCQASWTKAADAVNAREAERDAQRARIEESRRNYLGEAFQLVQGRSTATVEVAHLRAVVDHCRKLTTAALELPEVA